MPKQYVSPMSQQGHPHLEAALPLVHLSQKCTPLCFRTAIALGLCVPFLISIILL